MGRPPKPPQLKILTGTHRPDRHGSAAAISAERRIVTPPEPPLGKCEEFAARWNGYCGVLIGAGVLTGRDLGCLEVLCDAHVLLKDSTDALKKDGQYQTDKKGTVKAHPALIRKEQAIKMILQYQTQLGLTPSARAKVAPVQQAPTPAKGGASLRAK